MIRGLLEKELRQNGIIMSFLLASFAGALMLLLRNPTLIRAGSALDALRLLLLMLTPLSAVFLAQVLIASEFRNKTQLFLEGLPLPRWKMLAVKYGLGLTMLLFCTVMLLAYVLHLAHASDVPSPGFVLILEAKALLWTFFMHSLFFAHGFLGRYRVPVAIGVMLALIGISKMGVPVGDFAPFRLIDQRFAEERTVMPAGDLATTGILSVMLVAGAFALGLARDATVASLLAERMSQRERVVVFLLCAASIAVMTHFEQLAQDEAPVAVAGSYDVVRGPAQVSASAAVDAPLSSETTALRRVGTTVAVDLAAMADYLGCETLPPVFIIHRRDLKANDFQDDGIEPGQGLMVSANVMAAGFDENRLDAWIERHLLMVRSSGRADRDRNAWVLDGFTPWWRRIRASAPAPIDLAAVRRTMPAGFSAQTLDHWLRVRKNMGEDAACDLACSGLAFLAQKQGPEACRRFLSAMLAPEVPEDVRGWLSDALNPMPRRFQAATGMRLDDFVAQWKQSLAAPP